MRCNKVEALNHCDKLRLYYESHLDGREVLDEVDNLHAECMIFVLNNDNIYNNDNKLTADGKLEWQLLQERLNALELCKTNDNAMIKEALEELEDRVESYRNSGHRYVFI